MIKKKVIIIEFIERTALNKGEREKVAPIGFEVVGVIFTPPNQRFELRICNILCVLGINNRNMGYNTLHYKCSEFNTAGTRSIPGTVLKNDTTRKIIYTPPQDKTEIPQKFSVITRTIIK